MKRALIVAVTAIVLFFGIGALADLTQNRPDRPRPGWRSEIVLKVESKSPPLPTLQVADDLLGACQGTVHNHRLTPSLAGPDRVTVDAKPVLGHNSWKRLQGCLEDFTLDQVKGQVLSKRDIPPADATPTGS